MAIKNPTASKLAKTQVYMENMSFDPDYEVLTRIPLTLNPVSGSLERQTSIQGNASYNLTYDGSNKLTQIEKTINGTTYTKTFSWSGDNLTDISAWS
jgi:hypothetical protein